MKLTSRNILFVVVLTTALFADRATVAAPAQKPQATIAGRIVDRLVFRFCRVVPRVRLYQAHWPELIARSTSASVALPVTEAVHRPAPPHEFRLPPPTV